MRATTRLVGLVAVIALAGCGGGPSATTGASTPAGGGGGGAASPDLASDAVPSPPASASASLLALPDPCALITQEEAAIAVAAPVGAGVEEGVGTPDLGEGRSCNFKGTTAGSAMVETFENPGELFATYKLQQSQFGKVTDLPGAGDEAFTVGNYQCNVAKGEFMMVVTLAPGDGYKTDPEPRMIDLCLAASARF